MDKLLIRGIDTLIGSNLALALCDRMDVVGLAAEEGFELAGCRTIPCDLANQEEVADHLLAEEPTLAIYCGPLSASSWNLANHDTPDGAHEGRLAAALAAAAARTHSACAIINTDARFAGPRMFHAEPSRRIAAGPIADAASALEKAVAETQAIVVRTHAFGWSPSEGSKCFAERVWQQLSEGRNCPVDAQNYATPILASDLAELVWKAAQARLTGVYHITGAERTNQHRFAAELALAFGLTGRQTQIESIAPSDSGRAFAAETSLNTRAIRRALETPLPMLREGLYRFAEQADALAASFRGSDRLTQAAQAA